MAESILSELQLLVKQQIRLQEKLSNTLLKADSLVQFSHKEMINNRPDMMNLLGHLPIRKQAELKEILNFICQHPEVGFVILFGSYARGDWVEEYEHDGIHFKYQSDFDLLIIVSEICKASEQKSLERSIFKAIDDSSTINTPISILVHDINFINCHLKKAQYFFSDIKKEGIKLYDSGKFKLKAAGKLSHKQRYQLAKEDFEYWLSSAKEFLIDFKNAFYRKSYNQAAFLLHQTTERLYTCILLVFTRYKPNTHKLELLRKLSNALDKRLIKIFPLSTQEEIHRFALLCEAYVDARYNKTYTITENELRWLAEQVQKLNNLTKILCEEKINSFLDDSVKNRDQ